MYTFLSFVYILVCSFLIMVVLLQQGRGGGMGSLGGGSQTVFGGSGAGNLLTRLTSISAALFMILSATLAWLSSSGDTALEDAMRQREEENSAELHEALEGEEGTTTDEEAAPPSHEEEPPPPAADEAPADEAPADEAPAPTADAVDPTSAPPELPEVTVQLAPDAPAALVRVHVAPPAAPAPAAEAPAPAAADPATP